MEQDQACDQVGSSISKEAGVGERREERDETGCLQGRQGEEKAERECKKDEGVRKTCSIRQRRKGQDRVGKAVMPQEREARGTRHLTQPALRSKAGCSSAHACLRVHVCLGPSLLTEQDGLGLVAASKLVVTVRGI